MVCGSVGDGQRVRDGLLCKSFALSRTIVRGLGSLRATLLSLGTARDAVGAREVGDTKVKENREESSLVTRCETKVSAVKLEAAMCINPPFVMTLGHDEKRKLVRSLQESCKPQNAPNESIARSHELQVREDVTHRGDGALVEVTFYVVGCGWVVGLDGCWVLGEEGGD